MPSFGALGVGGTASLLIGSLMLTRDIPGCVLVWARFLRYADGRRDRRVPCRLAFAAQRQPASTGVDALARAAGACPHGDIRAPGLVDVRGEIWRATSDGPIERAASFESVPSTA